MARPKKKPEYNSAEIAKQIVEAVTDAYLNPTEDTCHGPRKVRIMCPIENPESRVISAYKRVGRLLKSAHRMR